MYATLDWFDIPITCEGFRVADTAGISEKTAFRTPPSRLTTPLRSPPNSPPEDCCGAELYWTMTFIWLDPFASSGFRSGEIFESSANPVPTANKTNHKAAHRANRLEY